MKTVKRYTLTWGDGFSQGGLTLKEVKQILSELLNQYSIITIKEDEHI